MSVAGAEPRSVDDFTFGERVGLVFIVEAGCLSCAAVIALLAYILHSAVSIIPGSSRKWRVNSHVHWYFISLLLSDLILAIGSIMNIRWIREATVTSGSFCVAQGIMKQIGDVGVALASLTIAVHTFSVLVVRWQPDSSPKVAILVVLTIWVSLLLVIGISLAVHDPTTYYGPTDYWCWITEDYPAQRIALEYFWLWFTALLNILLYVPLALVLKGLVIIDGFKIRIPPSRQRLRISSNNGMKEPGNLAMQMLFYPVVYTITVLPIAIVRWSTFYNHHVPFAATVLADVLFASSGLLNVVLFAFTRPALLPTHDRPVRAQTSDATMLSDVHPASPISRDTRRSGPDHCDDWSESNLHQISFKPERRNSLAFELPLSPVVMSPPPIHQYDVPRLQA